MGLPDFVDRCFNQSVEEHECPEVYYLALFPHVGFILLLPFQILTSNLRRKEPYRLKKWLLLELLLFILIISTTIVQIISKSRNSPFPLEMAVISLIASTMFLSMLSLLLSDYAMKRYNGLVITFLLAEFCFEACWLLRMPMKHKKFPIFETIRLIFLLLLNGALLRKFHRKKEKIDKSCPSDYSGWHRTLLISWFTKLVSIGYKKSLVMEDLFHLPVQGTSKAQMKRWTEEWSEEMKAHPESPSIARTIIRCFRRDLLFWSSLRFFGDFIYIILNPMILGWLISSVSSDSPLSFALLCAIGLLMISESRSLLNGYYIYGVLRFTVHVQQILSNSIFQKTLNLSPSARGDHTVGELVNLMAVDLEKICAFVPFATEAISGPLQLTLSMCVLTTVLGLPALGGLTVITFVIFLNLLATRFIKYFQIKQMIVKDERSKMCNEVMNGMKLIKLYAWEVAFEKRINELRAKEVNLLKKMSLVARTVDALNAAAPFIVAFVTFGIIVFTASGDSLTPEVVFVSLSIFNQLKLPMRLFALTYTYMVQARVSQKRIEKFLAEEEIDSVEIPPAAPGIAIDIFKTNLNWSGPTSPASLSNINLCVHRGEFLGIVGEVGSGKSSLLSCILGEMVHLDGQIKISGKLAYAPQQAWIQNTSLRNNVTLGKKFDRKLYKKVLNACELEADFAQIEHGDLAEIGENGVTLSGGQKARVGLARALYQVLTDPECDIMLFDDVLSAVDAHVGAALFEKVLSSSSGFLKHHTRLLVTHGLHYTRNCDRIVVMDKGKIHAIGTYQELEKSDPIFIKLLMKEKQDEAEKKKQEEEIAQPSRIIRRFTSQASSELSHDEEDGKIMQKEVLETGRVSTSVYTSYIRAVSLFFTLMVLLSQFAGVGFAIWRSLWLSAWSDETDDGISDSQIKYRLAGFSVLGFLECWSISL